MSCNCDYCGKPAELVTGDVIYPHRPDLSRLRFWQCEPCKAYVGCHKKGAKIGHGRISDGRVPLGRLANAELRRLKSEAHDAFDPLWKSGGMTRNAAYSWLANKMGLHKDQSHLGMFDAGQCRRVIELCRAETDPANEREWLERWGS